MILVNFKTYKEATGKEAEMLALLLESAHTNTDIPIIPVVQTTDIYRVSQKIKLPVYAQHVDACNQGSYTGHTSIEAVRDAGAKGTILNHSEHRIDHTLLAETVTRIRQVDSTFQIVICAENEKLIQEIEPLKPDAIAYEPPDLIGSTTESVATKYTNIIQAAADLTGHIPLLVGAGIRTKEDVIASRKHGASGILIASGIVKASDPEEVLFSLAQGF